MASVPIKTFTGEGEDIFEWFDHFEHIMSAVGWNNIDRLQKMSAFLEKTAMKELQRGRLRKCQSLVTFWSDG